MLPSQIASKMTVGLYTFCVLGSLMTSSMGLMFSEPGKLVLDDLTKYWRLVLAWPASIAIIRLTFYLCWCRQETANFYFDKYGITDYSKQKSEETLQKIYAEEDVLTMQKYLIYQHIKKTSEKKVNFCMLFTADYRRQMMTGIMFQFFQQFSGINFFVFYSIQIFTGIGQNGRMVFFVITISRLCASFLAMYMVEKFGRKPNFVIGILVQGIALLGFT